MTDNRREHQNRKRKLTHDLNMSQKNQQDVYT